MKSDDWQRAELTGQKYLLLLNSAREGITVVADRRIVFINPMAKEILGFVKGEEPKGDVLEFIHPDDRQAAEELYRRWRGGEDVPSTYECRIVDRKGRTRWLQNRVSEIDWEGGRASLASFSDITERKDSEFKRAAAESEWRQTFDSITDLISVQDLDFRFLMANQALADFVGMEPHELIGRHCYEMLHGTSEPPPGCPYDALLKSHNTETGEVIDPCTGLILEITVNPIFNEIGELTSIVQVARDFTEIRESARRLFRAELVSGMGFLDWDLISNEIVLSENICHLYGLDPGETLTTPDLVARVVHPDDREMVQKNLELAVAGKREYDIDHRVIRTDGKVIWVHAQGELTRDTEGKPLKLLGTVVEITERKRAETALKVLSECNQVLVRVEDEQRLLDDACRIIIEKGGYRMAWVGYTEDDERRTVRPVAQAGFVDGYLDTVDVTWAEEERGRGPTGNAIRSGKPSVMRDIAGNYAYEPWCEEALRRGYASSIALPLTHDGQQLGALNIYSSIPNAFDETEIKLLDELARDMAYGIQTLRVRTELSRSHDLLKASNERYSQLSDATTEGIVIHHEGKLLDVNRAFVDMSGYSREEAIGMSALEMTAPESRETVSANIRAGNEEPYEVIGLCKDGSTFPVELKSTNFTYRGQPVRLTTLRNLTEQKRLEKQILQSQKMESIGRLAGGIAHDFNNYLTAIQGYIELALMETGRHDPVHGDLEEALKSTERAASLTRQLLMFSRRGRVERKPMFLNKVIKELEKMLNRILGENYELLMLLGADEQPIEGDTGLLEQAIMNLVLNARDAMPDGGRISISTGITHVDGEDATTEQARAGEFMRLTVSDEGRGMDAESMEHIFEPFFSTKQEKEGTGLGLAVVFGIVEEHGGWIEVDSTPGRGSSFILYFPKLSSPAVAEQEYEQTTIKTRHEGAAILLVEDEGPLRAVSNKMLSQCGYRVYAAANCEEALELFEEKGSNIQLAFCDVVLPGENGVELAGKLLNRNPELKIILTSGYSEKSVQKAITKRGYSFLIKPYRLDRLVQLIEELLSG